MKCVSSFKDIAKGCLTRGCTGRPRVNSSERPPVSRNR